MKTSLFIITSALALAILLIIQINWILKSAELKEEQFNQRTTMALSRTVEDLCTDEAVCRAFRNCLMDSKTGECSLQIGAKEQQKVDSLLNYYLKSYHLNLNYSFEIVKPDTSAIASKQKGKIFSQSLERIATGKNMELKLLFPDHKEFIIAEMGTLFVSSVILIFIIIALFFLTIKSLKKEKRIFKETKDFVNNMTHELKTPIANISLASNFLVKNYSGNTEKIKSYSEIIQAENKRLNRLVERTLSVASLARGELMDLKDKVDIHEVIRESVKNLDMQIQDKGTQLTILCNAEKHFVSGDQIHLIGAFSNLLDNANKYSKEQPEISIKTYNSEKNIVITVTDNGIGIHRKKHEKIFDAFYRIYNGSNNDIKGDGLGLAYVKKVIEAHDGTIGLNSEPQKGCHFEIFLPLMKEQV